MKLPISPPPVEQLVAGLTTPERLLNLVIGPSDPCPSGKYRHWDILRHLTPPEGLSLEEWWLGIKVARRHLYRELPLTDVTGRSFRLAPVDPALQMLHEIDRQASGAIRGPEAVTDPHTRDTYLMRTLIEEAITSSQLEGASTTRAVAKDMLQRGREPRNRSERMIFNNYLALEFIRRISKQPLTPSMVFEIHRLLTNNTLENPDAAGRFRTSSEDIHVVDEVGTVLHIPPKADELEQRLERLCEFANDHREGPFVHPVVRAILLHFALAYDHPFVDGNGRTARALFYWAMASSGYWLCEYLSISRIIKRGPGKYSRAFLYVESDDNDVTYFVLNQLKVTIRAIRELHKYLARKTAELENTRAFLRVSSAINATLNHRQLALLNHALRNPGFAYAIDSHRRSHNVSYQTARTDLLDLADLGILELARKGRAFAFYSPIDLQHRVEAIAGTRSKRRR